MCSSDLLQQFAVSGNPGPWNAYVNELGKAMEFDASEFFVQPPQPPPPEQQGPSPEEIAAQAKQAESDAKLSVQQHKMEMDHARGEQQMQMDQERHDQEMDQAKEKGAIELALKRALLRSRATEVPR